MTIVDILQSQACQMGQMPKVITEKGTIGQITTIRDNGKYKGVGVQLPGLNYETWYHDSPDTDKRSRYMRDLKFAPNE